MASNKLSRIIVNERLLNRGITMMGEYSNSKTKTMFMCCNNHTWSAQPSMVLFGNGCPHCNKISMSLTKEEINNRLLNDGRGITLVGEYFNNYTLIEFRCSLGHNWMATSNSVLFGNGCPHCDNINRTLSKEKVIKRLIDDGRGITMIGEYTNSKTKTLFECSLNHTWSATPDNVFRNSGCPKCAEYGFNPSKEAWGYILDFGNFLKFGITNNLSRRLEEHKRNGKYKVVHEQYHDIGQNALDWERGIKHSFGGNFVDKSICPDGYTETLCISILEELMEYTRFEPILKKWE